MILNVIVLLLRPLTQRNIAFMAHGEFSFPQRLERGNLKAAGRYTTTSEGVAYFAESS